MWESAEEREEEFLAHLWDHAADPFQASFDLREDLTAAEIESVRNAVTVLTEGGTDDELAKALKQALNNHPEFGPTLVQLVGLTANKLKNDLDAGAENRELGIRFPSDPKRLTKRDEVWALAGPYLARRFRTVFGHVANVEPDALAPLAQSLNQATWPGFMRARRAKLSGHEAEHRIALLFQGLGIAFEPECKAVQPACPDVEVKGHSFDLVVPEKTSPAVVVISGVQAANIGQFGQSKTQDLQNAVATLTKEFGDSRPAVLAMIDGVGYRSNRAGLLSILENADEFVQFGTLWKAGVLAAVRTGLPIKVALPPGEAEAHKDFLHRYPSVEVLDLTDELLASLGGVATVEAGEGLLVLAESE